jgi:RNA polymerase sigma-B factor
MDETQEHAAGTFSVRQLAAHREHVAVFGVRGEIDLQTAPMLREALRPVLEHQTGRVVVDLSEVPFMDSAGVQVLADTLRRLGPQNRSLAIVCHEEDQVHRLLAFVGLLDALTVYQSRSDARALTQSLAVARQRPTPKPTNRETMLSPTTLRPEPSRDHRDATNELLRRWHEDRDGVAREALVDRFMPLARRLANRYRTPHEPIDDLIQVAAVGLLGAIDRFDPGREIPFTSFAIPTILGELKRYFRDTGWSVHVPRGPQELALQVARATELITAQAGRPPRVQDLAEYLELSREDVVAALDTGNAHYAASLDAPLPSADPDDPKALIETISHTDGGYGLVEATVSLSVAMARLPYLERRALQMRLGGDLRQQDIAVKLGCSQMQVSRLLRRAAAGLREMMDSPQDRPLPAAVSPA